VSAGLRATLVAALRSPRRRLGAAALADGTETVRAASASWAWTLGGPLCLVAVLAGTADMVRSSTAARVADGDSRERVFRVTIRYEAAPAEAPVAAEPEPEAFGPPERLPPPEDGVRTMRVGSGGNFTLEDALAGREGIDAVPKPEVAAPSSGLMRLTDPDAVAYHEARRRCGAIYESDSALEKALDWLVRHQRSDGAWGGPDPVGGCHTCLTGSDPRAGLTGLALLACVGARGGSADTGDAAIRRAVGYLLRVQGPDGCVGPKLGGYLYDHGFATWALVEAAERFQSAEWRRAAQRAVWFVEDAQQDCGGFDYTERSSGRGDACLSAVMTIALRAAADAGLQVRAQTLRGLRSFHERVSRPNGTAHYAVGGPEVGASTRGSTASTYLARLYLGDDPEGEWMRRARGLLIEWRSDWAALERGEDRSNTLYFWFLAAQGLIHSGPEAWRLWNTRLQGELIAAQQGAATHGNMGSSGCARGSWPPPDAWISKREGPVFSTALGALLLETYTRQAATAKFSEPLRSVRDLLADEPPLARITELIHRAEEEGDRTLLDARLPDHAPPLAWLEFGALVRRMQRPGEAEPAVFRGLRLRDAWRLALADRDPAVRRRAAAITPQVILLPWYPELARAARSERDPETRVSLIAALEQSPELSLLEPVLDALHDSDPRVCSAAIRLVRGCRVRARLADCLALTASAHPEVERDAVATVLGLSDLNEPEVASHVIAWLQHKTPEVRKAAQDWVRRRDARAASDTAASDPSPPR